MHPRFEAALIDLDGTLVDTVGDFEAALGLALADLGLPAVGRNFVLRTIGKGSENLIIRTLAHLGADAQLLELAMARYQHHYLRVNGLHSRVYPGVVEGLTALTEAGLRLACLTNKPQAFARPLLEHHGLDRFFGPVFGGDAFARKKPDPLPLLEAMKVLHCIASRTLMVGDSSNDALAARAAACPVVLVSYGYNHGEPIESVDADAVVERLDQVLPLLDRLKEARRGLDC